MKTKVLILGTDCDSTWIIANYLNNCFQIDAILIEQKVSKFVLLKNRIKRLGYMKVFGQLCFQVLLYPIILKLSKKRINQICELNNLDKNVERLNNKIIHINNINDKESLELLTNFSYDVIVINGTRILNKKLISSIKKPIINTHVGITPKYRGVHGAYWALVNGDKENCGVTVHHVDTGIDTGKVINQAKINPAKEDNFATYPYLQIAAALPLLSDSIKNPIKTSGDVSIESRLWYHPTIFEYISNFLFKSIS